jgi:hypothetical protein
MAKRLVQAATVVGLMLSGTAAFAQEGNDAVITAVPPSAVLALTPAAPIADLEQGIRFRVPPAPRPGSSPLLSSMYATTAVLQGLDVHSTITALNHGAVESNPLMVSIVRNRPAFIATKAAVAAATILAARQMAKRNKLAAFLTLAAVNSAYALVVRHNYRVARGQ